jgi:hypothetical protein
LVVQPHCATENPFFWWRNRIAPPKIGGAILFFGGAIRLRHVAFVNPRGFSPNTTTIDGYSTENGDYRGEVQRSATRLRHQKKQLCHRKLVAQPENWVVQFGCATVAPP